MKNVYRAIIFGVFFLAAVFIVKDFVSSETVSNDQTDIIEDLDARIIELEELNEELVSENEELRYELEDLDYRLDDVETILEIP